MLEHYDCTSPQAARLFDELLANTLARKKIEARIAEQLDLKEASGLILRAEATARRILQLPHYRGLSDPLPLDGGEKERG